MSVTREWIFLQADVILNIPKEHHRYLLGKGGQKLKDLEKITACKISVPNISDPSDAIKITGSKEGIEKAVHEIRVTSDEQVGSSDTRKRVSVIEYVVKIPMDILFIVKTSLRENISAKNVPSVYLWRTQ